MTVDWEDWFAEVSRKAAEEATARRRVRRQRPQPPAASAAPPEAVVHQIGFRLRDHQIGVTCTCLRQPRRGRPAYADIDVRAVFPAPEALAAWRAWHEQNGVAV